MNRNSQSRAGTPISLIVVHTNEGPHPAGLHPDRTAENLAAWMENNGVSYHKVVDDDSVVDVLPDSVASWSVRSGNNRSLNICFTGYAAWTRADWLAHDSMLRLGAQVVQDWCVRHVIPLRKLTPAQVGADWSGICGHVDWTLGKHDGTHTDPGSNFPYDLFLDYVFGGDMSVWDEQLKNLNGQMVPAGLILSKIEERAADVQAKCDHLGTRIDETAQWVLDHVPADLTARLAAIEAALNELKGKAT